MHWVARSEKFEQMAAQDLPLAAMVQMVVLKTASGFVLNHIDALARS